MAKDLTKGNPAKLIVGFAIPLMLGSLFQQLYSMADTLIVGRTIGVQALAAVGCTGTITFLIIGFAQGMTYGFSIITAQHYGAKNTAAMRRSFAASVVLSVAIALLLTLISVPLTMQILRLMRTPAEIIDDAGRYLSVVLGGMTALVLFNLLFNMIRAMGDSRTPLLFVGVACVVNVVLDFWFILQFHMGVAGAAWATVISQAISALLCLVYMRKKVPQLRLQREDWKLTRQDLVQQLRIGIPVGFQNSILAIGTTVVQVVLNQLGANAVAAYTAAGKIEAIASSIIVAYDNSIATYTAQNYGAREIERIQRGVHQCRWIALPGAVLLSGIVILAGRPLIELFVGSGQEKVMDLALTYLRISSTCYVVSQLAVLHRGTLQGLGKTIFPTIAGAIELGMRIFAALILARLFGFTGVCFANCSAWIAACIFVLIAYAAVMRNLRWTMQVGKNAVLLLPGNRCDTMQENG